MSDTDSMRQIDRLLSHVWMVRTFIKHSDEVEEDDDLQEVQRVLYDYMLALGSAWKAQDAESYLRQARKKRTRLRDATALFAEIQPEISTHTNFQMAVASLQAAVHQIDALLRTP